MNGLDFNFDENESDFYANDDSSPIDEDPSNFMNTGFDSGNNNNRFVEERNSSNHGLDEELMQLEKEAANDRAELEGMKAAYQQIEQELYAFKELLKLNDKFSQIDRVVEKFMETASESESYLEKLRDESAKMTLNEMEKFLAENAIEMETLTRRLAVTLEEKSSEQREFAMSKVLAESRHAEEIKDLKTDISSMRSQLCETETKIGEEQQVLNAAKDELKKDQANLEEAKAATADVSKLCDAKQEEIARTDMHSKEEVETLTNEIKILQAKRDAVQLELDSLLHK